MDRQEQQQKMEDRFVELYAAGFRTGVIMEKMSEEFERSVDTLYRRMNLTELKKQARFV